MAGGYRAQGLVLRRTKLGEADLIVTLLCDVGRQVRAVAKGARKPGSRLTGVVGAGNEVSLLLHEGRSLDVITEGRLTTSRADLAREVERVVMAEAVLDCAAELTAEGECDARLLPLTTTALDALEAAPVDRLALVTAAYVFKAAAMQGYRPSFGLCVGCGEPVDLGRARVRFAVGEGGVVCDACADEVDGVFMDGSLLAWAQSLLAVRFSDLLGLLPSEGERELGASLLDLARTWLEHHPGVRPRALDFALGSGLL